MISLLMVTGEELNLPDMEVDEWIPVIDEARRKDVWINVHDPDGRKIGINPDHIVYWELRP